MTYTFNSGGPQARSQQVQGLVGSKSRASTEKATVLAADVGVKSDFLGLRVTLDEVSCL